MDTTGLKRLAAVAVVLALAGCAPEFLPVDASGARTALPRAPGSADLSRTTAPLGDASDTCGARALAYLVGKPRTEIPVAADLGRRRVVCAGCVALGATRPDRQTISYDPATERVTSVVCN